MSHHPINFQKVQFCPYKRDCFYWSGLRKNNGIIIEDDYDSELRYNSRPIHQSAVFPEMIMLYTLEPCPSLYLQVYGSAIW